MGNVKDQKHALEARANLKKTWEDLIQEAKVKDMDAPLKDNYEGL